MIELITSVEVSGIDVMPEGSIMLILEEEDAAPALHVHVSILSYSSQCTPHQAALSADGDEDVQKEVQMDHMCVQSAT